MRFMMRIFAALLALSWFSTTPVHAQTNANFLGCCSFSPVVASTAPASPATYINSGAHNFAASTETFAFPTGAAAGDILIVSHNNGSTAATTTFSTHSDSAAFTVLSASDTWTTTGYHQSLLYKVLTSAEIADGTMTVSGSNSNSVTGMALYRGPTSAAKRSFAASADADSTLVFSGFAPAGNTAGAVAIMADRDTTGAPSATGFTTRLVSHVAFDTAAVADRLSGYTNATVTFSGFTATIQQVGYMVELLN